MKKTFLICLLGLLVYINFVRLYGFLHLDDSGEWLAVGRFFLSGAPADQLSIFSRHWLVSPLSAIVGAIISYPVMNFFSYILNSWLLFNLTRKLTGNLKAAAIAAILFMIDFHTQQFSFAIMADSLHWSFLLLLINFAIYNFEIKTVLTLHAVIWGCLMGLGVLVKADLGFLFFAWPLILYFRRQKNWLKLTVLAGLVAAVPVGSYYFWLTQITHLPFFSILFTSVDATPGNFFVNHLFQYFSAFLYQLVFIIVGLVSRPFLSRYKSILIVVFGLTLIPVLLWPSIEPRHSYLLFWVSLPLAAVGLVKLTKRKTWLLLPVLLVLFWLNTSRNYLETHQLSHPAGLIKFYETYLHRQ